ncbi:MULTISPECIES: isochorismatase family protein [unclassified Herbaspirillum]|uniref:isochorismatase family protein n=1 Tax=unclassified Herbaspirillum TaxID=2624150 RepID=UPI00114EC672|nr:MULTISPECIES: isochorismatase family protein [unclassified Herbaspirillum]MBB5390149.1 nicotinamidase-related amidase [Herbaspirillum sp. SJZ102]TQK09352.1 nicotinamidase-related amidase [Herbaspirillum sp. SJZ130]TQK13961.1 nicotinamidase-related amidase [Herbaspirillum sp. SJZ106]
MSHPTIRSIAGALAPVSLEAASTALLVIDFQNEYFTGMMPIPDGKAALANARRLVAMADRHRMPVFHVQHVTPAGTPIFAEGGATVALHPEIQPAAHHHLVRKANVSVFQGTDIEAQLKAAGIKTLLITGLMTHACVAGAARDAAPAGFDVIVAADACATRDIEAPHGGVIAHDALHRASLVSIADTFGSVLDTNAILEMNVA